MQFDCCAIAAATEFRRPEQRVRCRNLSEACAMCHVLLIGLPLAALSLFWLLPLPIALPTFVAALIVIGAFYRFLYQGNRMPVLNGAEAILGATGKVLEVNGRRASVWVRGELWTAQVDGEAHTGDRVQVLGMKGLRLDVRRLPTAQSPQQR